MISWKFIIEKKEFFLPEKFYETQPEEDSQEIAKRFGSTSNLVYPELPDLLRSNFVINACNFRGGVVWTNIYFKMDLLQLADRFDTLYKQKLENTK